MKIKKIDKLFIAISEDKGGSRKSHVASMMIEYALHHNKNCVPIDGDRSNSTTYSMYGGRFVDVEANGNDYAITEIALEHLNDGADVIVVDFGARNDALALRAVTMTAEKLKGTSCAVVVVRPITLNAFVQENALNFAKAVQNTDIGVLFARCECAGEYHDEFGSWMQSGERALVSGWTEEFVILDFTSYIVSNACSFNMPYHKLGQGDFSSVDPKHLARAKEFLKPRHEMKVAEILIEQRQLIDAALSAGLQKRGMLYGPK